ncbi:MAG TPA: cob(I)yrinic acid a,c-diamide adenosyltransferase [Candidatus Limnocylindria bacterium]|nr:cob(I)yrinic acid a,c-diamide adenosyltransferase [Candidatus Limnocylindria bacterium]
MQSTTVRVPGGTDRRRGLVIVFTGDGKGKTTAAMGMALRATGNHMRVRVIQFIKGAWKTGEVAAVAKLAPSFEIVRAGRGFTIERLRDERIPMEEHAAAARAGLEEARASLRSGDLDMLVLDEILGAVTAGLVSLDDVLALVAEKPPLLHLVLTGRGAPPELVEVADLVTEMRLVKHPYAAGIRAQRGVEF